jgi:hypothetical protein
MDELDEELNRERRKQARLLRQRRRNKIKAFFRSLLGTKKAGK